MMWFNLVLQLHTWSSSDCNWMHTNTKGYKSMFVSKVLIVEGNRLDWSVKFSAMHIICNCTLTNNTTQMSWIDGPNCSFLTGRTSVSLETNRTTANRKTGMLANIKSDSGPRLAKHGEVSFATKFTEHDTLRYLQSQSLHLIAGNNNSKTRNDSGFRTALSNFMEVLKDSIDYRWVSNKDPNGLQWVISSPVQ